MQTGIWMTYSDSTHYSDQISYKIYFIPSYRLQNIIYARLKHFLQFLENRKWKMFLTQAELAGESNRRG
jgi:hypothetical protein